jgi:hypothetical protein
MPEVLTLELPNDAPTPVKFDPSIAGSVPVILAAGTFVKLAALIAGKFPVKLAAGTFVKLDALIAGSVPLRLPAGKSVKFAPDPVYTVADTIPETIAPSLVKVTVDNPLRFIILLTLISDAIMLKAP